MASQKITSEHYEAVRNYLFRLVDFMKGISHSCPMCQKEVHSATFHKGIEQDSGTLYVEPCGCRLGQMRAPKWIEDVKIIPFDIEDCEDDEDDNEYEPECGYCNDLGGDWTNDGTTRCPYCGRT